MYLDVVRNPHRQIHRRPDASLCAPVETPCGPCPVGPPSSKLTTGGVFPTDASVNGEIS